MIAVNFIHPIGTSGRPIKAIPGRSPARNGFQQRFEATPRRIARVLLLKPALDGVTNERRLGLAPCTRDLLETSVLSNGADKSACAP